MYLPATPPCWSSRPQVRNVFHRPRSVKVGLVEAGVTWMMPFSANTADDGMDTAELKLPTTNLTPSATNLLATETPCLASETSSPRTTLICSPLMPPAALMSAAACSAPFWSCAPKAAFGPVSGPATPTITSAHAAPPNATIALKATADKSDFFILLLPNLERVWFRYPAQYPPSLRRYFYFRPGVCTVSRNPSYLFFHENGD